VGALDAQRPRSAVITAIVVVSVCAVASVATPRTDTMSFTWDLADVRIAPLTMLAAIASDRPAPTLGPQRSEHPGAIPAVISVEAVTRSAFAYLMRDVPGPRSRIATSRFASGLVRRGPPSSLAT
jgi:hypothetical protein